ncbi:class I SAM-dependent methyltransferase [Treponema sp. OttesenSCG-928-L16]|nr:class I SAM-dependent methyltransferase [Treponema sp. OttesenSCG-928-L16]
MNRDDASVKAYQNKSVVFRFRGKDYSLVLSHGLFSSAGIDSGTRLLLKVLSHVWDEDMRRDRPLPRKVLDAGCGAGIIGIAAAGALAAESSGRISVRCQDRDELARAFTAYNARANGIPPSLLESYCEPLLAGPSGAAWDLILSNIPAKAGRPVLEDFISRSAALLEPGGKVIIVIVNPIADICRAWITEAGLDLTAEESGAEHTVFVFTAESRRKKEALPPPSRSPVLPGPVRTGLSFFDNFPFYRRASNNFELEHIPYHIDAVYGAADFDSPGGTVYDAAKLAVKINLARKLGASAAAPPFPADFPLLIHEPDQGHFSAWLLRFLFLEGIHPSGVILSGRNILALEASRRNTMNAAEETIQDETRRPKVSTVPAADLAIYGQLLLEALEEKEKKGYAFIAAAPETVPKTERLDSLWEGAEKLLAPGGIIFMGFSSSEAERFDRKKTKGFTRLGDIKRKGFRVLAYQKHFSPGFLLQGN